MRGAETRPSENPSLGITLAGLLLAFILPQLPIPQWFGFEAGISSLIASEASFWAIGAAIVGWVVLIEERPLASIGIRRPSFGTLGWALAATLVLMASVMLSYAIILPALGLVINRSATRSIIALPLAFQMAIFLRAGVVEEIVFRGYPIERLEELTRSKWLAALLPGAAFIAGHYLFWGPGQLVVVAFGTVILTLLYLWRRDLICCVIAHAATDAIGFTLARLQS